MALFGFGKKKAQEKPDPAPAAKKEEPASACACGCSDCGLEPAKSRFIVLGACCGKSIETLENTKTALRELGFTDEVASIGDNLEIAKYGVMQTPALVIDGKVVSVGKFLKVDDVKKIIEKLGTAK